MECDETDNDEKPKHKKLSITEEKRCLKSSELYKLQQREFTRQQVE